MLAEGMATTAATIPYHRPSAAPLGDEPTAAVAAAKRAACRRATR